MLDGLIATAQVKGFDLETDEGLRNAAHAYKMDNWNTAPDAIELVAAYRERHPIKVRLGPKQAEMLRQLASGDRTERELGVTYGKLCLLINRGMVYRSGWIGHCTALYSATPYGRSIVKAA